MLFLVAMEKRDRYLRAKMFQNDWRTVSLTLENEYILLRLPGWNLQRL